MNSTLPNPLEAAVATGDLATVLDAALAHFDCQAGTVHLLRDGVLKLAAHRRGDVRVISTITVPPALDLKAPLPEAEATAGARDNQDSPAHQVYIQ